MLTPAEPETQRGSYAPRCRAGQPVLPSRVVFLHGLKSACLLGIEEQSSDLWPNCWSERLPRSHAPGDSRAPSTRGEGQGPGDMAGAWIKNRARSQPWQATERFHLANSRPFQRDLEVFFPTAFGGCVLCRSIISFMEDPRSGHGKSLGVFSLHVWHRRGHAGRTGHSGNLPGMPMDLGRFQGPHSSLGMIHREISGTRRGREPSCRD